MLIEKEIAWLDVSVKHARLVSRGNGDASVDHPLSRLSPWNRSTVINRLLGAAAAHPFHGDVWSTVDLVDVKDGDDVGMIDLRDRSSFADEAFTILLRSFGSGVKHLESDEAIEDRVLGEVKRCLTLRLPRLARSDTCRRLPQVDSRGAALSAGSFAIVRYSASSRVTLFLKRDGGI